jgi:hypothetical protein
LIANLPPRIKIVVGYISREVLQLKFKNDFRRNSN